MAEAVAHSAHGGQQAVAVVGFQQDIHRQIALCYLLGDMRGIGRLAAQLSFHLAGNQPGYQRTQQRTDGRYDQQQATGVAGIRHEMLGHLDRVVFVLGDHGVHRVEQRGLRGQQVAQNQCTGLLLLAGHAQLKHFSYRIGIRGARLIKLRQ